MILPKERDPRFITLRRGGTLTDADHRLLALWAATCADHVLPLFEVAHPSDARPRQAIARARVWVRGDFTGFSLERLFRLLIALDNDISIVVAPKSADHGHVRVVAR